MYDTKIVADSIAENGCRLTTFEITMPRIILAEWNTHRVFSRNTASSRAIPVKKMIDSVMENPFIPERFPKNEAGMSNSEWLEGEEAEKAKIEWLESRNLAVDQVQKLIKLNVHKQIANRILEPFMWVTSVTSSTQWKNFFTLRNSKLAQPEIMKVASAMQLLYDNSEPVLLRKGEWHLPYVKEEEKDLFGQDAPLLSAGRCGKVSYLTHGETNTPEKDISIARDKMVGNKHWSPVEHPATPLDEPVFLGNYRGWKQQRKFYNGEAGE